MTRSRPGARAARAGTSRERSTTRWKEWQERWRRAAILDRSPWIMALALAFSALLADLTVLLLPRGAGDLGEARALGIVSHTTIEGYPKSADSLGYAMGLLVAVLSSLALWLLWARRAGAGRQAATGGPAANEGTHRRPVGGRADREAGPRDEPRRQDSLQRARHRDIPPPARWWEWAGVTALLLAGFLKLDLARSAFASSWMLLSEEGQMMAWVDTLLRGGVLSRDVFCLYGPLTEIPVAWLFERFAPSVWVWRVWIYALNIPALLLVYALLRSLTRTRVAALAGMLLVGFLCTSTVPAMSWSLSRVALGLGAIACLYRHLAGGKAAWLVGAGALVGIALSFSQEVGLTTGAAVAVALLATGMGGMATFRLWLRRFALLALGVIAVVGPLAVWLISQGALAETFHNLFLFFPKVRMLGFAGYPFPSLNRDLGAFLAYPGAASAEQIFFTLGAYFGPAALGVCGFLVATRVARDGFTARLATQTALLVFGVLLFPSALTRPDETHLLFCLPPALILLACFLEESVALATSRGSTPSWRAAGVTFVAVWLSGFFLFGAAFASNLEDFFRQTGLVLSGRWARTSVPGAQALDLPRAGPILLPREFARDLERTIRYVQERTRADEPLWAYPNEPMINFLAERPLSNAYPQGLFAITRAQRQEMVEQLRASRPSYAVFHTEAVVIDHIPHEVALPEPTAYLRAHYEPEAGFGGFLVLRRK